MIVIETFSTCLDAWMKETSRSMASLSAEVHLKSKTTVARILQGRSTWNGCSQFYELLSRHVHLEDRWARRFQAALRTERIGASECALLEALDHQIRTKTSLQPSQTTVPAADLNMEPVGTLLILGCPWEQTYDYIRQCMAENRDVRIFHYVTYAELYNHPPVLSELLNLLTEARYQVFLVEEDTVSHAMISWNIMIKRNPESNRETFMAACGESFICCAEDAARDLSLEEHRKELDVPGTCALYHNEDMKNGSDYIRFQKDSLHMENMHRKTIIKPTAGIQMLPADISIQSFRDFLTRNTAPIATSAESIIYYFRKRAENFYNRETKMILSRRATMEFALHGKLPDQFYACRPFTIEERMSIFRYLLNLLSNPQVTILFAQRELSRTFSFEAYSTFGVLIYPSQTSYNVEKDAYRELIFPGRRYADLMRQYVDEIVIPEYCGTEQDTRKYLNQILIQLQTRPESESRVESEEKP